jgi:hypothetical protein
MAVQIDWSQMGDQPNLLASVVQAYHAGRQTQDDNTRRAARQQYQSDPAGGINAMAGVDPTEAASMVTLRGAQRQDAAVTAAEPQVQQGDYMGAARTIAAANPEHAHALMQLDADGRQRVQQLGVRGGQVMLSAANMSPEQRGPFMAQHRDEVLAAGLMTPEQFDAFPWSDPSPERTTWYRNEGAQFMGLGELAGSISMMRFGDNEAAVRTTPAGAQIESSTPIPATREETRAAGNDAWTRNHTETEDAFHHRTDMMRLGLQAQELQQQSQTPDRVIGGILTTLAGGGTLTPGQESALSRYVQIGQARTPMGIVLGQNGPGGTGSMDVGGGGSQGGAPSGGAPPAAATTPAPTGGNIARPQSQAEYDALPPGALYIDPGDGRQRRKAGGARTR